MIEKTVVRNGKNVVEVRSGGGKLLYRKTPEGYEMKCPRTKDICVVGYEAMLSDCVRYMSGITDPDEIEDKIRQVHGLLAVQA